MDAWIKRKGANAMSNENMKISQNGRKLIEEFEGLRLSAYQDSVGVWTIGYGHTKGVYPGMVISLEQANVLLDEDVTSHATGIFKYVQVALNQNQFDALVSFHFNLGANILQGSTLLNNINSKNWQAAANEMMAYVHAGGQVLPGLVRRRKAESELFLKGDIAKKVTKYFCGINVGADFKQVQAYRVAINNQWKIDYLDIYYYQEGSSWFIGINNLNFTGDGGVQAYRMAFNSVFAIPFDKITYYSYDEQAWEIGYSGVSLSEYQNLRLRMMAKGLQLREVQTGASPDRYDVMAINLSFRDIQRYRLQFMSEFADIIVGTRVTYNEM